MIGAPNENVDGIRDAGAATVLYGSESGLSTTGARRWSRASAGIKGALGHDDTFGKDLVILGARHRSGVLVAGVPDDDLRGAIRAGSVTVIRGSAKGLTAAGDQYLDQRSPHLPGQPEEWDQFGTLLSSDH